jgi:hypothetical protein
MPVPTPPQPTAGTPPPFDGPQGSIGPVAYRYDALVSRLGLPACEEDDAALRAAVGGPTGVSRSLHGSWPEGRLPLCELSTAPHTVEGDYKLTYNRWVGHTGDLLAHTTLARSGEGVTKRLGRGEMASQQPASAAAASQPAPAPRARGGPRPHTRRRADEIPASVWAQPATESSSAGFVPERPATAWPAAALLWWPKYRVI